ncbi:MAG: glycosyltransferase family 39 protein [Anaerolineales bacterium]
MSSFLNHGSKQKIIAGEWLFLILLVCGYYFWLSKDAIYSASTNGRLVDRFETDEYQLFSVTNEALVEQTLYIDWSVYGHFYFNIALIPLFIKDYFGTVSDQFVILTMRYVSLISSALTVLLTFGIARRYFNKLTAWVSALLLMVIPTTFNYWSIKIHPDTLQVLMVVACLFACCESIFLRKKEWLLLASVFAGMSFSTKYVGAFLMPIIWLFYFLFLNQKEGERLSFSPSSVKPWVKFGVATGLLFFATFVVTSPSLLVGGQIFDGLSLQMRVTRSGYIFATNNNFYEWFGILSSPAVLGMTNSLFLGSAFVSFFVELWKSRLHVILSIKGLLWSWVLFYFSYALINVNLREDRYLMVIIAPAFILTSQFIADSLYWTWKKDSTKLVFCVLLLVFIGLEGFEISKSIANHKTLIETMVIREVDDSAIEAGHWLEANYPSETRILYDRYSYIPPKFTRVQGSYGMDLQVLLDFNPRVVVINRSIRDIYLNPSLADSFTAGAGIYMAMHDFYEQMENEMLGYHLVREFEGIKIFERNKK